MHANDKRGKVLKKKGEIAVAASQNYEIPPPDAISTL